jgi:hypothetical protein
MAEKEYIRLTRQRQQSSLVATTSSSLWLGKDHLLVVESSGYSEKYRRFYFKDIQVLAMCKTKTGMIRWIVLGVVAGFFGLLAIALRDDIAAVCILGLLALVLAIIAVCDALAGPTASCSMRTAVHMEVLPSLDRVRRARKVFERLKPVIAAAQGTMSFEEVVAQMQVKPVAAPVTTAPRAPQAAEGEVPPKITP